MSCDVDSAGRHSSGEPVSHATPSRAPSSVRDNPEHWRTRHPCRPNSSAGGVGDHLHVISTEHSQVVGDRVALDTKLDVDELTPLSGIDCVEQACHLALALEGAVVPGPFDTTAPGGLRPLQTSSSLAQPGE